ncbi:hypothetical protein [Streptomyces sp. NBC_01244]|uniref:hypothetical protein n=1 Tax=Streptomyces sp. NBC_01244 TaxID=2903797 RepID=UPI003FA3BD2B
MALLTLYQALPTVMGEAAESLPGNGTDRCRFTVALQTARDLVVQPAGIDSSPDGYQWPHPQTRPRPLRRQSMDTNTACMTCENANYPALGQIPRTEGAFGERQRLA